MKVRDFLENVNRIAQSNPTYRTGGDGSDGTCDCIGLVMGAIGKEYPMHSTNYFARYELTTEPWMITENIVPDAGDLVFRARKESNPKYDLHERYKPGGRYSTGNLLDYYHVGVVMKAEPLEIIHCTETGLINGIAKDYTLEGWTHLGVVEDMEYEDAVQADKLMMVRSEDGYPVKLRATPSTELPYIDKIPNGELVIVYEKGNKWSKIGWNGKRGYMMSSFLHNVQEKPAQETEEDVQITLKISRRAAWELYNALIEQGAEKFM